MSWVFLAIWKLVYFSETQWKHETHDQQLDVTTDANREERQEVVRG